jgi:acetyl esterase/lipase
VAARRVIAWLQTSGPGMQRFDKARIAVVGSGSGGAVALGATLMHAEGGEPAGVRAVVAVAPVLNAAEPNAALLGSWLSGAPHAQGSLQLAAWASRPRAGSAGPVSAATRCHSDPRTCGTRTLVRGLPGLMIVEAGLDPFAAQGNELAAVVRGGGGEVALHTFEDFPPWLITEAGIAEQARSAVAKHLVERLEEN